MAQIKSNLPSDLSDPKHAIIKAMQRCGLEHSESIQRQNITGEWKRMCEVAVVGVRGDFKLARYRVFNEVRD